MTVCHGSSYSYSLGYDGNGNVTGFTDSVAGSWPTIQYDALHRLTSMSGVLDTTTSTTTIQEMYDNFGNRQLERYTYQGIQAQPEMPFTFTQSGSNHIDQYATHYDPAGNLEYELAITASVCDRREVTPDLELIFRPTVVSHMKHCIIPTRRQG